MNAVIAAGRFVKAKGLTWQEVLGPPAAEHRLPESGTWRGMVARWLGRPGSWRSWEPGVLTDRPKFQRLSIKQRYILKEMADRVLKEDSR